MSRYVAAIDQGTTSTRLHDLRPRRRRGRPPPARARADPAAGRLGRAQPGRDLGAHPRPCIEPALNTAGLRAGDLAALGHHQPARDHGGVEPRAPAGRTTTRSSGRTPAPTASPPRWTRDGRGDVIRRKAGLPPATYFSGGKLQWILENVDGVREAAERGDALFGTTDTWLLWNLTGGPRRRRARHRRHQRQPHHADEPRDARLGRRAAGVLRHPARDAAADQPVLGTRTAYGDHRADGPLGGEVPLTGVLGDQQAAMVGQVCFAPGEAKNTYGTGNFLLLNTGEELVRSRTGCSPRCATSSATRSRSTRSRARSPSPARRCSGCATSSASSAARRRVEALARQVDRQRRRLLRAGVLRAVRAVLAVATPAARSSGCPGSTPTRTWPGPRWRRSATRAATSSRRWRPTPACTWRCSRSTAASPPTTCACRSRPTSSASTCQPAGGRRDHRARRGLRGRAGRRVLGGHRRAARQLARGPALEAGSGASEQREAGYAGWQKAVQRTLDWVDVDVKRRVSSSRVTGAASPEGNRTRQLALSPQARTARAARTGSMASRARRARHRRRRRRRGRALDAVTRGLTIGARRGARLGQRHVQPVQQAHPRRPALPGDARLRAWSTRRCSERGLLLDRIAPHLVRPVPVPLPAARTASGSAPTSAPGWRSTTRWRSPRARRAGCRHHRHLTRTQALREASRACARTRSPGAIAVLRRPGRRRPAHDDVVRTAALVRRAGGQPRAR